MKSKLKLLAIGMMSLAVLAGCGSNDDNSAAQDLSESQVESSLESPIEISGSISMDGSTSMEKLANALNEVFGEKYPNVQATVQFTGSSSGINSLINGTVDIGNASRALTEDELAEGLVANVVAIDGIAVIINNSNGISDITTEQLIDIYNGTINNWSELGGDDLGIVVIGREAGSGTRSAFEEILGIDDEAVYAQEQNSTGAVVGAVSSIDGAIGYVSLDSINDTVKALSLEGVTPTTDTVKSGEYTLSREFIMATKGEISEQSEQVQEYFNFIYSEEGKEIIEIVGLTPAN